MDTDLEDEEKKRVHLDRIPRTQRRVKRGNTGVYKSSIVIINSGLIFTSGSCLVSNGNTKYFCHYVERNVLVFSTAMVFKLNIPNSRFAV